MIEKLTAEQEADLCIWRDKWVEIGLSTAALDWPEVERAVKEIYGCGGLEPPKKIVRVTSPLAGVLVVDALKNIPKIKASVWDSVRDSVRASVRASVWASVGASVWDSVRASVSDSVRASVSDSVRDSVEASVKNLTLPNFYGQHESGWLSFYDFFQRHGMVDCSKCAGLWGGAKAAGWMWLYKDIALVCEKSTVLSRDERGRLHGEKDAAIKWSDGWGVWAWHGVRVSEKVIISPQSITPQEIDAEQNAEVRRVMVERFGVARYLLESDAKIISEDGYGKLFRKEVKDDEPIVLVQVRNATPEQDGERKKYFLRVPPTVRTAREAVAWTFEQDEKKYSPQVES